VKSRIICIGNRLIPQDAGGLAVLDRLRQQPLPDDVELVEGGLAGLNLLPLLEDGGRVVFVDSVAGFVEPGRVVILDQETIIACLNNDYYGHDAGLAYLLSVLPGVCEGQLPEEMFLVGLEGECTDPVIAEAAGLSLAIAMHGFQDKE